MRRRSLEIVLNKVESIGVIQPLLGRVFDYGTIVVSGSGGTRQSFPTITGAMGLRQEINQLIGANALSEFI